MASLGLRRLFPPLSKQVRSNGILVLAKFRILFGQKRKTQLIFGEAGSLNVIEILLKVLGKKPLEGLQIQ